MGKWSSTLPCKVLLREFTLREHKMAAWTLNSQPGGGCRQSLGAFPLHCRCQEGKPWEKVFLHMDMRLFFVKKRSIKQFPVRRELTFPEQICLQWVRGQKLMKRRRGKAWDPLRTFARVLQPNPSEGIFQTSHPWTVGCGGVHESSNEQACIIPSKGFWINQYLCE